MNLRDQFKATAASISSSLPLLQNLALDNTAWKSIGSNSDVQISSLQRPELKQYPSMVKGVTKIYDLSLANLFKFNYTMDVETRKELNPLMVDFQQVHVQPGRHAPTLLRAWFQPPVYFISRRDYVFLMSTFIYDKHGNEIVVPNSYDKTVDEFIVENKERVQRVVSISRSVTEDELSELDVQQREQLAVKQGDVRGFLRCNAWIGDKIDDNSCHVTVLTDLDLGGNIPDRVKGFISQYNADGLVTLKRYLEQRKTIRFML
jgi:hypothetical protein